MINFTCNEVVYLIQAIREAIRSYSDLGDNFSTGSKERLEYEDYVLRWRGLLNWFDNPMVTLYAIKRGYYEGLGTGGVAERLGLEKKDVVSFLLLRGLNHKEYRRRYRALAEHLNISFQAVQSKVNILGLNGFLKRRFRSKRNPLCSFLQGSGVVSMPTWNSKEVLFYSKDLYSFRHFGNGLKVILHSDNPRYEWYRLRFSNPDLYLLEGEGKRKFPGVRECYNRGTGRILWEAVDPNRVVSLGYYRTFRKAFDALRYYVMEGKRRKVRKGQVLFLKDLRRKILLTREELKESCAKFSSQREVASNLGVSVLTLSRYLKRYNLPTKICDRKYSLGG